MLRSDVVMLALPGNYHRRVMDTIAPHLRAGQTVLISGHLSFGALHLSRLLAGRGVEVPIVVWGTTVTTGRRSGAANVTVNNVREQVDVAVVPDGATAAGVSCAGRCSATGSGSARGCWRSRSATSIRRTTWQSRCAT